MKKMKKRTIPKPRTYKNYRWWLPKVLLARTAIGGLNVARWAALSLLILVGVPTWLLMYCFNNAVEFIEFLAGQTNDAYDDRRNAVVWWAKKSFILPGEPK